MVDWRIASITSGVAGAVLGFALASREPQLGAENVVRTQSQLQPTSLRGSAAEGTSAEGSRPAAPTSAAGAPPNQLAADRSKRPSEQSNPALVVEVASLRERERTAQRQVEEYREQIRKLETELGIQPPRHRFDLTAEDWRDLASKGAVKYRIPCGDSKAVPSDEVLQELGLGPDDMGVLRSAYDNSAKRLNEALMPLCTEALGGRVDIAKSLGVNGCRHVLITDSRGRGENGKESAQRVASYRAGDAPLQDEEGRNLLDETFLVLTDESRLFEKELTEAWGPEEAHRVVYSDRLCFTSATHVMTGQSATGAAAP
jgi:hypothetical protein